MILRVTEWVEAAASPLDITRRNPVEKYLCIVHYSDYLTGSTPGSMKNMNAEEIKISSIIL